MSAGLLHFENVDAKQGDIMTDCSEPGCGRRVYWSTGRQKWYHVDPGHEAKVGE